MAVAGEAAAAATGGGSTRAAGKRHLASSDLSLDEIIEAEHQGGDGDGGGGDSARGGGAGGGPPKGLDLSLDEVIQAEHDDNGAPAAGAGRPAGGGGQSHRGGREPNFWEAGRGWSFRPPERGGGGDGEPGSGGAAAGGGAASGAWRGKGSKMGASSRSGGAPPARRAEEECDPGWGGGRRGADGHGAWGAGGRGVRGGGYGNENWNPRGNGSTRGNGSSWRQTEQPADARGAARDWGAQKRWRDDHVEDSFDPHAKRAIMADARRGSGWRNEHGDGPDPRRIKVTNVPRGLEARDIQDAFEKEAGKTVSCELSRGTVMMTFVRAEHAAKAIDRFDRGELNGSVIRVALDL